MFLKNERDDPGGVFGFVHDDPICTFGIIAVKDNFGLCHLEIKIKAVFLCFSLRSYSLHGPAETLMMVSVQFSAGEVMNSGE